MFIYQRKIILVKNSLKVNLREVTMEFHHVSVLLNECIENLNIKPDGVYVDCTMGGAGHSKEIVKTVR